MNYELIRMIQSKSAYRRQLIRRPLVEKLAMLDALRERALGINVESRRSQKSNKFHTGFGNPTIRP